jgi:hypothetical protein
MSNLVDRLADIVRVHGMLITNSSKEEEFTTIPANFNDLVGDLIGMSRVIHLDDHLMLDRSPNRLTIAWESSLENPLYSYSL